MGVLKIDEISARTLPALDKVFLSCDDEKMTNILTQTKGEPLKRLTLAALSRHRFLGGELTSPSNTAALLEEMIGLNLTSLNEERTARVISNTLDHIGDNGMQLLLTYSILRYNSYDNAGQE